VKPAANQPREREREKASGKEKPFGMKNEQNIIDDLKLN
jgi:hypothetical protein